MSGMITLAIVEFFRVCVCVCVCGPGVCQLCVVMDIVIVVIHVGQALIRIVDWVMVIGVAPETLASIIITVVRGVVSSHQFYSSSIRHLRLG